MFGQKAHSARLNRPAQPAVEPGRPGEDDQAADDGEQRHHQPGELEELEIPVGVDEAKYCENVAGDGKSESSSWWNSGSITGSPITTGSAATSLNNGGL